MNMQTIGIGIVALLVLGGAALAFLSSQSASDSMMEEESEAMMPKADATMGEKGGDKVMQGTSDDRMMSEGTYETYSPEKLALALANEGKVVLYFHADWCPICRPLDAALKKGVPAGIHILKVDYDTATELKQRYGVTYQHTFVQVDAAGKLVAKWGDAFTAADVFARVK